MRKNNLNEYRNAYKETFRFFDENILMLSRYSQKISEAIRENHYKTIMSLGVGHKIVSKTILSELGKSLEKYVIIEGSSEIIDDFKKEIQQSDHMQLINSLFEEFDTNETFDAIEIGFVLEHIEDPSLLLHRYAKFLKSSGTIFIAVPNARSLHRLIGHHAGLLDNIYRLSTYDRALGHKRYFDVESLVKLVQGSGLKIVALEGLFLKPFSTTQLQSLALPKEVMNALLHIGVQYPEISNAIYIEATS